MKACVHCGRGTAAGSPGTEFLAAHVCPDCGLPRALDEAAAGGRDFFAAFGVPRRFRQDRALLEKRFYALSKALHPDRFTQAGEGSRQASLERMSLLNEAYRTLRDPELLRQHVLEQARAPGAGTRVPGGASSGSTPGAGRAQIPMELAEGWFELQDALIEEPERARAKLGAFESELRALQERAAQELRESEAAIDAELDAAGSGSGSGAETAWPGRALEALSRKVQEQAYLKSMERDVERIKKRLAG